MRVARQASTTRQVAFVFQLKAEGHDEADDTFETPDHWPSSWK